MDETKLKEARTNLIERVAELTKEEMGGDDFENLKDLLSSIERIDELLKNRRLTP